MVVPETASEVEVLRSEFTKNLLISPSCFSVTRSACSRGSHEAHVAAIGFFMPSSDFSFDM